MCSTVLHICACQMLYMFGADIIQAAFITERFCTGGADSPSMIDKTVAELVPFFRWDDLPKLHLYLFWILDTVYQTDTI